MRDWGRGTADGVCTALGCGEMVTQIGPRAGIFGPCEVLE